MSGAEEFVTYDAGGRLVRSRMIELTAAEDGELVTDRVEGEALLDALIAKLDEEFGEFKTKRDPRELVDIIQAALDIGEHMGIPPEKTEELRRLKLTKRGGFLGGVIVHIAKVRRGSEADRAYAAQPDRFERIDG